MKDNEISPEIADLVKECLVEVKETLDFELDFSVETLPVVDHFGRTACESPHWPDNAERLAQIIGAYFGEVLRNHFGGHCRWRFNEDGFHSWRLEFESCFLCFNPLGSALELLLDGEAQGWNSEIVTLPAATPDLQTYLQQLPGVSEEDYYRLAIRFESIEIIKNFLETWQNNEGDDRRYCEEDYDEYFAELDADMTASIDVN